jgi:hypothetical protein
MRVVSFEKAFPQRANLEGYVPLIEAALNAGNDKDGNPQVVVEDYTTVELATKAANSIRGYCQKHQLNLAVSCPKESKSVSVYKSKRKPRARKNKDADAAQPDATATTDESTSEES